MAPRKKLKDARKKNGGVRNGSGRKPAEHHFAALNERLDKIEALLAGLAAAPKQEVVTNGHVSKEAFTNSDAVTDTVADTLIAPELASA